MRWRGIWRIALTIADVLSRRCRGHAARGQLYRAVGSAGPPRRERGRRSSPAATATALRGGAGRTARACAASARAATMQPADAPAERRCRRCLPLALVVPQLARMERRELRARSARRRARSGGGSGRSGARRAIRAGCLPPDLFRRGAAVCAADPADRDRRARGRSARSCLATVLRRCRGRACRRGRMSAVVGERRKQAEIDVHRLERARRRRRWSRYGRR